MKRILPLLLIVLLAIPASAQTSTFFEAGLGGSYGSNAREKSFPEIHGAVGFKVFQFKDSTIQLRAKGKLSQAAELADLFTRDNNPLRMLSGEVKVGIEGRWNMAIESYFKPFIATGFEYTRQFGLKGAPYSALNPTLTFGTRAGYGYEAFYTRIFEDRLNRSGFPVQLVKGPITTSLESSRLRGDRIGGSYLFKVTGKLHIKAGLEADYLSYRACSNAACDAYRERDWIARPFVAVSIF